MWWPRCVDEITSESSLDLMKCRGAEGSGYLNMQCAIAISILKLWVWIDPKDSIKKVLEDPKDSCSLSLSLCLSLFFYFLSTPPLQPNAIAIAICYCSRSIQEYTHHMNGGYGDQKLRPDMVSAHSSSWIEIKSKKKKTHYLNWGSPGIITKKHKREWVRDLLLVLKEGKVFFD